MTGLEQAGIVLTIALFAIIGWLMVQGRTTH